MVLSFGDLRKGMTIELEGVLYQVVDYQQHKMQQRTPVTRLRLRELRTGKTLEKSFSGFDVKFTRADVENRPAQYIYRDGDSYYFMDQESFEQYPLNEEQLGEVLKYLKEQAQVELVMYKGQILSIEMPNFVELKITSTPPGVKGDTAQGGTKPATLETGVTIQVPLFVNQGEVIRVDTRSGQYLERVG